MSTTTLRDVATAATKNKGGRPAAEKPAELSDTELAAQEAESIAERLEGDTEFSGGALAIQKTKLEVVKIVTVPVLKFDPNTAIICQIIESITVGTVANKDGKYAYVTKIRAPSGQLRTLVLNDVLRFELQGDPGDMNANPPRRAKPGAYPDDSYVGKWFHIGKFAPDKARDKRYATFQITEIADPRRAPEIDATVERQAAD